MSEDVKITDLHGLPAVEGEFLFVADCISTICTDPETGERSIGFIINDDDKEEEPLRIMFPIAMAEVLLEQLPALIAAAKRSGDA